MIVDHIHLTAVDVILGHLRHKAQDGRRIQLLQRTYRPIRPCLSPLQTISGSVAVVDTACRSKYYIYIYILYIVIFLEAEKAYRI